MNKIMDNTYDEQYNVERNKGQSKYKYTVWQWYQ